MNKKQFLFRAKKTLSGICSTTLLLMAFSAPAYAVPVQEEQTPQTENIRQQDQAQTEMPDAEQNTERKDEQATETKPSTTKQDSTTKKDTAPKTPARQNPATTQTPTKQQTTTSKNPTTTTPAPKLTEQELKEILKNAQQRQELQRKMNANKTVIDGAQGQKYELQTQYNDIVQQASDLQAEIDDMDAEIQELSSEIEITEQELDDKYEAYCNRVRAFEEYGTSDYWAILFQSTSLTDLLGRWDFIREVMDHDQQEMNDIEKEMKELDEKKRDLEDLRADRNAAEEQLEDSLSQLGADIETKQSEITQYETENQAYLDEYQTLLQRSMALEAKSNSLVLTNSGMPYYSGSDYQGSKNSADVYQKYIVESGELTRNPLGSAIVKYTLQFNGGPYVWGGATPEQGFDCSGLMYYVYGKFGYNIMRVAEDQYHHSGKAVAFENLQAGDMIFFHPKNGSPTEISHVGMYICDGIFVHAASRASGIKISSLYSDYYSSVYVGAKRIIE